MRVRGGIRRVTEDQTAGLTSRDLIDQASGAGYGHRGSNHISRRTQINILPAAKYR